MPKQKKALVVTTEHKGVFFGYGTPTDKKVIKITKARMCVYWDSSLHGVMGLASQGPNEQCRISPAVPVLTVQDITGIMEVSKEAIKKWEAEPWG